MVKIFKTEIPATALIGAAVLVAFLLAAMFVVVAPFRDLVLYGANQFWFIMTIILLGAGIYFFTHRGAQPKRWIAWDVAFSKSFSKFHIESQLHCRMHDLTAPLQPTPLPNSGRWHIQVPHGFMGDNQGWCGVVIQGVMEEGQPEPGFVWEHTENHLTYPLRREIIDKLDKVSDPTRKILQDYAKLQTELRPVVEEHQEQIGA